jgi:hypothetical protein
MVHIFTRRLDRAPANSGKTTPKMPDKLLCDVEESGGKRDMVKLFRENTNRANTK